MFFLSKSMLRPTKGKRGRKKTSKKGEEGSAVISLIFSIRKRKAPKRIRRRFISFRMRIARGKEEKKGANEKKKKRKKKEEILWKHAPLGFEYDRERRKRRKKKGKSAGEKRGGERR